MSTSEDHRTGGTGTMEEPASRLGDHDLRAALAAREHGSESAQPFDERRAVINAFLFAVAMDAAIVGLFLFITWLAYATD